MNAAKMGWASEINNSFYKEVENITKYQAGVALMPSYD